MSHEQKPSEGDRTLEEIRREVIESRNLVIKTDNLLKNLHAELKMVGKRQEDFQRRQWISSGVAYALFAVLCAAGAVFVSSARSLAAGAERERLEKERGELLGQLEKQRAEANAGAQSGRAAAEAYRMMTTLSGDRRLDGIQAMEKLDHSRLSPLEKQALQDRAELLRREASQGWLERGKAAFRRQDYPGAASELGRFVAANPIAPESVEVSFQLGASLLQLKKAEEAVPHLSRFIEGDKRAKTRDYAMLLLAQAYEQSDQPEKAAATARQALEAYPASEFVPQLKGRLAAAKRATAPAPAAPAALPAEQQVR